MIVYLVEFMAKLLFAGTSIVQTVILHVVYVVFHMRSLSRVYNVTIKIHDCLNIMDFLSFAGVSVILDICEYFHFC